MWKAIYYEDKAIVLVYHDVCKNLNSGESNSSTVTSAQLQDHLQMLKNRGFHIVSMDDFIQFMLHGKSIPPNSVVLTFDDGYTSFYTEAFPILRRFGASASNFIVGITSDLFNPDAELHLNWEQMRELKAYGMGFYNHTYNLHRTVSADRTGTRKPALTTSMYLEQRQRPETEEEHRTRIFSDLSFLEKRFEQELGKQHKLLAFPYGAYDEVVLEEGTKAGMELFFTVEEGINKPGSRIIRQIQTLSCQIEAEPNASCVPSARKGGFDMSSDHDLKRSLEQAFDRVPESLYRFVDELPDRFEKGEFDRTIELAVTKRRSLRWMPFLSKSAAAAVILVIIFSAGVTMSPAFASFVKRVPGFEIAVD